MSEKTLVRRLKRADSDAFKELYHIYVDQLYAFVVRTAKSPALAEDMVHDVFVKVWENRHQIDPEQSFRAYLFTIARNHLLNLIKRSVHEKDIINRMLANALPAQNNSTGEQVLYNESHRLFHEAVELLPAKRKKVFQLCHLKNLTYEETAERMGITPSTVNSQMVKARKFIREYLVRQNRISKPE